ncbi:hypothetical protein FHS14_003965 [Paenibacillus baekrokdamisoli]|uniref:hypothetical protein n=1 Tax=Paenibacillus baekrokdamisoli TaxID=1712516 RepID=UPI000F7B9129|nr:hypothetical protein [Paenibacillus baekrokdamisoli]MBB3070963.1 hypothetical protein [Paenibacillus baekrokdamisoli]
MRSPGSTMLSGLLLRAWTHASEAQEGERRIWGAMLKAQGMAYDESIVFVAFEGNLLNNE